LWWWLLCRKLVSHTMSYRKAHKAPPTPRADRQYLRAPPPTPPELDPQAREPCDNTIDELLDHPKLMQRLSSSCARFLGLPSQPVASPKWDLMPMLPARVRRIVYMYCWGPPDGPACSILLTKGGRQDWLFQNARANKYILGIRLDDKITRLVHVPDRSQDPHFDDDGGISNDDTEPFVGTDDEDRAPEARYVNVMHSKKPRIAVRRIVNAPMPRVEPRP